MDDAVVPDNTLSEKTKEDESVFEGIKVDLREIGHNVLRPLIGLLITQGLTKIFFLSHDWIQGEETPKIIHNTVFWIENLAAGIYFFVYGGTETLRNIIKIYKNFLNFLKNSH